VTGQTPDVTCCKTCGWDRLSGPPFEILNHDGMNVGAQRFRTELNGRTEHGVVFHHPPPTLGDLLNKLNNVPNKTDRAALQAIAVTDSYLVQPWDQRETGNHLQEQDGAGPKAYRMTWRPHKSVLPMRLVEPSGRDKVFHDPMFLDKNSFQYYLRRSETQLGAHSTCPIGKREISS
jgi:hypothetical protein